LQEVRTLIHSLSLLFVLQVYHVVRESETEESGKNDSLGIDDWMDFLRESGLVDSVFGEEEAAFCYVMSMPIVVDEMQTDRHTQMTISDFIEAIGSPPPPFFFSGMRIHVVYSFCQTNTTYEPPPSSSSSPFAIHVATGRVAFVKMQGLPMSPQYVLTYYDTSFSRNSDRVGSKKGNAEVSDRLQPFIMALGMVLGKIDKLSSFKGIEIETPSGSKKDNALLGEYGLGHLKSG
jgi:hypothetical protein